MGTANSLVYMPGKGIVLNEPSVVAVSLPENKILADSNCHEFNKKLEMKGVEVIETDVSELKKNGGSIRCMTLPILRR